MYEGVRSKVVHGTKFDESSHLGTAYLGRVVMTRSDKIKAEEKIPISEQGFIIGRLLDGAECQILLDTETSLSFMFKTHF